MAITNPLSPLSGRAVEVNCKVKAPVECVETIYLSVGI